MDTVTWEKIRAVLIMLAGVCLGIWAVYVALTGGAY